jgi:hypothetical protein
MDHHESPSDNGTNGRDHTGRFSTGNRFGRGRPAGARNELRQALVESVSEDDIREVVQALIRKAKSGDVAAAREVLDRCCGRTPLAVSESRDIDWSDPQNCPVKFIVGVDPDALS